MIVQIYEIQTPEEAEAMVALGVDHIGSVLVSREDWKIPSIRETLRQVKSSASKSCLMPLFNSYEFVCRALDYYVPDFVHFCEDLSAEGKNHGPGTAALVDLQMRLKQAFPEIQIIRTIPIAAAGAGASVPTMDYAKAFDPVSDFFLTDTIIPSAGAVAGAIEPTPGFVGITGKTCDWDMARQLVDSANIPVILAGGINPANAFDAATAVRPYGLDSCTGTNAVDASGKTIRFKKDKFKVKQLVEAVRRAEQWLADQNRDK